MLAPPACAGDAEKKRAWAVAAMKNTARAARNLGVDVVTGFTGSPIWHLLYRFPPVPEEWIEAGYARFAALWNPILDVFEECGVKFALEVHPAQIAFDGTTARRALEALVGRRAFGFNFDPSHLVWQMVDPVRFLREFADRIYHVHVKDVAVRPDGTGGVLGSHLRFGDPRRIWDFRSPRHGDVPFADIYPQSEVAPYDQPEREPRVSIIDPADVCGRRHRRRLRCLRRDRDSWRYSGPTPNPYQVEHDRLFEAIRNDRPFNEAEQGALSTMTAIMGRMATYSGEVISWDQAFNSELALAPVRYDFAETPPVLPGPDGNYPCAVPGVTKVL